MRKIWAPITAGVLAFGGALVATPAVADDSVAFEPQVLCDVWGADTHNYRVVQTGLRTFEVRVVDLLMFAAGPGEDGGEPGFFGPAQYVPIPEDIRFATNTISLGAGAEAANFTLSQGVTTVPDEDDMPVIETVTGGAPNSGEGFTYDDSTGTIVWVQDTDAQTVNGVPIEPNFPPFVNIDLSAGVLSFDLTLPDGATGEVDVISGIAMTWNTHAYNISATDGFTWHEEPIEVLNNTLSGCSVELEPLPIEEPGEEEPGEEVPGEEVPSEEEPGEEPTEEDAPEKPTVAEPKAELAATGSNEGVTAGIVIAALALTAAGTRMLLLGRRNKA